MNPPTKTRACSDKLLDVFVVASGNYLFSKPKDAIESFGAVMSRSTVVTNQDEINSLGKASKWYAVIYDDEYLDPKLSEALPVFLRQSPADVLMAYKMEDKTPSLTPRFFKRHVKLAESSLLPEDTEAHVYDRILNGWIFSNRDSLKLETVEI